MLEYDLKQAPSGPVTLSILDAKGQEIQRFSSQAKGAQRTACTAGNEPVRLGHAVSGRPHWRQHRSVAVDVGAAGLRRRRLRPDGTSVRLTVGSQTYEEPLDVQRDPNGPPPMQTCRRSSIWPCRSATSFQW